MLGYMTTKEAIKAGMTHHGSYFGIPIWLNLEEDDFICCAKWSPFDYLMNLFHYIEGFLRSVYYPNDEPVFQFKVLKEI